MDSRETIIDALVTPRDYLRWGVSRFNEAGLYFGHGTDNAYDEALYLVCHALHLPPDIDPVLFDARLTPGERKRVLGLLQRRIDERVPAAYLTGEAWFAGLRFVVDARVLVPRSPIAELIEHRFEPWLAGREPQRILDLCAGSGCIGIACARAFEGAEVDLAEISADALDIARRNVDLHGLEHQVRALRSDLFEALQGERYDLIVSNPPYVDARDLAEMPAEYHAEPAIGLASGEDGLDITRRILREAAEHLNEGGLLVVEVGNSWPALEAVYPDAAFTWIEFERGGHGVFVLSREELLDHTW